MIGASNQRFGVLKVAASVCCCILSFCSCNKHNQWVTQKVHADSKNFCSTKLSYPTENPLAGIDLELLKTEQTLDMFLAIHNRPIPSRPDSPNKIPLKIESKSRTLSTEVIRHAGGQKFTVEPSDREFILECLNSQEVISLVLPGYKTTIDPNGFLQSYERFIHPTSLRNPFHLPF